VTAVEVRSIGGDVVCAAAAASCICHLMPGHTGPHECGRASCNGAWLGDYATGENFTVIRWPEEAPRGVA
jgi:hypothetical protein